MASDRREGSGFGQAFTEVATKLMGKHKPSYLPNIDSGDYVVIINAKDVSYDWAEEGEEALPWHTGWPGGLKEESAESLLSRKPEEVIRRSVLRMLPDNRMRKVRARKLRIFADANHTHHEELGQLERRERCLPSFLFFCCLLCQLSLPLVKTS